VYIPEFVGFLDIALQCIVYLNFLFVEGKEMYCAVENSSARYGY
jgi:hypothetical protein